MAPHKTGEEDITIIPALLYDIQPCLGLQECDITITFRCIYTVCVPQATTMNYSFVAKRSSTLSTTGIWSQNKYLYVKNGAYFPAWLRTVIYVSCFVFGSNDQ